MDLLGRILRSLTGTPAPSPAPLQPVEAQPCKTVAASVPEKKAPAEPVFTSVPGRPNIYLRSYYDSFLWYYPNCEMLTKEWFVQHTQKDWVILDCGANIGYYSILFSQLAPEGVVYAFEPTATIEKLKDNLEFNGTRNVVPLKLALGCKTGRITDSIYRIWGQDAERMDYDFTTVDDWVDAQKLQRVDCIKIDVDSFDFEVLQGCERTLKQFNPYVVVELCHALSQRNQSVSEALEWMCAQGYKECLCLEYYNFVFHRTTDFQSQAGPLPSITTWLKSAPRAA